MSSVENKGNATETAREAVHDTTKGSENNESAPLLSESNETVGSLPVKPLPSMTNTGPSNLTSTAPSASPALTLQPLSFMDYAHMPILFVVCLTVAWFLGRFNYHILWFVLSMIVFLCIYSRRLMKFSKLVIFGLERDAAREKLNDHTESVEWLNLMISRFWTVYEPVLSASIIDSVNTILETNCPSFMSAIKLTHFTLGSEPPAITSAKGHSDTDSDIIHLDLNICFIPRRSTDDVVYPFRQKSAVVWSSKIVLAARFGASVVGVDIPVMLEDICLEAKARVQMKLMTAMPLVKIIQFSLTEPPKIDFILKPLKSLDIMDLPGLNNWLRSLITSNVSNVMVNPNMITINLNDVMNKSRELRENSIGVLRVIIYGAKVPKTKDYVGVADPYARLLLSGKVVAKTKWISDSQNPVWNETFYLLVQDLATDILDFQVMQFNHLKKDKMLAVAEFHLKQLKETPIMDKRWQSLKAPSTNNLKGEISYAIGFHPILENVDQASNYSSGILKFMIHQAKEIIPRGSSAPKALSLFAECSIVPNAAAAAHPLDTTFEHTFKTFTKKRTNSPTWEASFEHFVKKSDEECLWIVLKEERDLSGPAVIGDIVLPISELASPKDEQKDWYSLRTAESGRIRISYLYQPVDIVICDKVENFFTPSLGLVNVTLLEGKNILFQSTHPMGKNLLTSAMSSSNKAGKPGKVYAKTSVAGDGIMRTKVIEDTANPVWLASSYSLVKQRKEVIVIELFEAITFKQDKPFAYVEVNLDDVCANPKDYKDKWAPIVEAVKSGSGALACPGELHFSITFHPILEHVGPDEKEATKAKITELEDIPEEPETSPSESVKEEHHDKSLTDAKDEKGEEIAAGAPESDQLAKVTEPPAVVESNCGILVVTVLEGRSLRPIGVPTGKTSYVCEMLVNKNSAFSAETSSVKGLDDPRWGQSYEFMIFDYSKSELCVRLKNQSGTTMGLLDFPIQDIVKEPVVEQWIELPATHYMAKGSLKLSIIYKPVSLKISAGDLEGEPGTVYVTIVSGAELMAVDSSGTSDPFVILRLNGKKAFKTKVIKKNLNPKWNEKFSVPVGNRKHSIIGFECRDWNRIDASDPLGFASIHVSALPTFKTEEELAKVEKTFTLALENASSGKLTVRMALRLDSEPPSSLIVENGPDMKEGNPGPKPIENLKSGTKVVADGAKSVAGAMASIFVGQGSNEVVSDARDGKKTSVDGSAQKHVDGDDHESTIETNGASKTRSMDTHDVAQVFLWGISNLKLCTHISGHHATYDIYIRVRQGKQFLYKSKVHAIALFSHRLDAWQGEAFNLSSFSLTDEPLTFDVRHPNTFRGDETILRFVLMSSSLPLDYSGPVWLEPYEAPQQSAGKLEGKKSGGSFRDSIGLTSLSGGLLSRKKSLSHGSLDDLALANMPETVQESLASKVHVKELPADLAETSILCHMQITRKNAGQESRSDKET